MVVLAHVVGLVGAEVGLHVPICLAKAHGGVSEVQLAISDFLYK